MRIYTYVIAVDGGAAPNRDPPLTTLAICEPRIRKTARPGDAVLAFNGSGLGHPDGVRWAGVVCEKLTFAEYWLDPRFQGKKPGASRTPDNTYAPSGTVFTQVPNTSHVPKAAERDLSGKFVFVLEPAWHFGLETPILPEYFGLRITAAAVGTGFTRCLLTRARSRAVAVEPWNEWTACSPKPFDEPEQAPPDPFSEAEHVPQVKAVHAGADGRWT